MKNFRTSNYAIGNTGTIKLENGGVTSPVEEDCCREGYAIRNRMRSIETGTRREGNKNHGIGIINFDALNDLLD